MYLALCVTMLTVIPLAISLVASVPIQTIETRLLRQTQGVNLRQKMFLMALRVFNHVVYYVIPDILEVTREERRLRPAKPSGFTPSFWDRIRFLPLATSALIRVLIQIAVEGICSAIQYIPLWAVEIAQVPRDGKNGASDQ